MIPSSSSVSHMHSCAPPLGGAAAGPAVKIEAAPAPSFVHDLMADATLATGPSLHPIGEPALGGGSGRNLAERKEWKLEEDEKILALVKVHGQKWRVIAAQLPGRSDDAVRNRWNRIKETDGDAPSSASAHGSVKPSNAAAPMSLTKAAAASSRNEERVERISWSRREDETIVRLVGELGNKWNLIAFHLPGRTEHAIRNRFSRLSSLASRGERIILSSGEGMPIGIQLVPKSVFRTP